MSHMHSQAFTQHSYTQIYSLLNPLTAKFFLTKCIFGSTGGQPDKTFNKLEEYVQFKIISITYNLLLKSDPTHLCLSLLTLTSRLKILLSFLP